MSLILVATVSGVLLERLSVGSPDGRVGYAGAERGTRAATVRGPPTAVFDRSLCQKAHGHRMSADQSRIWARIRAAASSTGTSWRSPLFRSRTSITPSARPRPTVTIVGM